MMPKKGARKITLDGVTYRWSCRRARENPIDHARYRVAVETAEEPVSTLVMILENVHILDQGVVARSIRHALGSGWLPSRPGTRVVTFSLPSP